MERAGVLLGRTILAVVLVMILFALWTEEKPVGEWNRYSPRPQVIAHRAGAALGPENTLAALEASLAAGTEGVEVDVRMTRDGQLILLHDESLVRTTGLDRAVGEMDWDQIAALDAGGGARIPTLEEFLEAAGGRVRLMVEVKEGEPLTAVDGTVAALRAAGLEGSCILASVQPHHLARSKEIAPELQTFYIGDHWQSDLLALSAADGYSIRLSALTPRAVGQVRDTGKELWAWAVNTPEEVERALSLGVDGLVTDDPGAVLAQLGEEN